MISKQDWTLLVLAAAEGASLSPVQLQKSLFLIGKNVPWAVGDDFYQFIPYNYGPFDPSIYSDAESLAIKGLLMVSHQPGRKWYEYSVSLEGQKLANRLKEKVPPPAEQYVRTIVKWIRTVSFEDLLRIVYEKYPDYAANSVFRG